MMKSVIKPPSIPKKKSPQFWPPNLMKIEENYLLCNNSCPQCHLEWFEIDSLSGQRTKLEETSDVIKVQFKHNFEILCQVSQDQVTKESSPFPLGLTYDPSFIEIARDAEPVEVKIFQHVPFACDDLAHVCSLQISFICEYFETFLWLF